MRDAISSSIKKRPQWWVFALPAANVLLASGLATMLPHTVTTGAYRQQLATSPNITRDNPPPVETPIVLLPLHDPAPRA